MYNIITLRKSLHATQRGKDFNTLRDKAYSAQYIADAPRYTDYLPIVQKIIESLVIK
jgi:hypothetical protein